MIKKIIGVLFIIFCVISTLGIIESKATLNLNELNFDVKINSDGSMDVIEIWNINASETNTLFKTFVIDSNDFSQITDVNVSEITDSGEKKLTKINEEMYHVTKDCYYALENSKGNFEIAWGIGTNKTLERKKYKISYTVKDVISKYNDYSQLYWQFIGNDFSIDANKVTGTITLPAKAENINDIRVWGHSQNLNGEVHVIDNNKIQFSLQNYYSGNYLEIRALIPNDMITQSNKIYNTDILNNAIEEETKWANEANEIRKENSANSIKGMIIFGIIILFILSFFISIIVYIIKLIVMEKKNKPTIKIEYYRDLPYNDATPAEGMYMLSGLKNIDFSDWISASILDLCLKNYITLELLEDKKIDNNDVEKKDNNDVVKIIFLDKDTDGLKEDEKLALSMLKDIANDKKEITTDEIKKYFQKNYSKIIYNEEKVKEIVNDVEIKKENINLKNRKKVIKYGILSAFYLILFCFSLAFYFIPAAIVIIINFILVMLIISRINVYTQKGIDELEQWIAFKRYMNDFSLLQEKDVPDLIIWEKYLVFATAFGISDKVLREFKSIYYEMSNSSSFINEYNNIIKSASIGKCINLTIHSISRPSNYSNSGHSVSSSSSHSSSSSSGSGFGGGFSSGGGHGGGRGGGGGR